MWNKCLSIFREFCEDGWVGGSLLQLVHHLFISLKLCVVSQFAQHKKADIAFVVDHSSSVGQENWGTVIQFLQRVVRSLSIGPEQINVAAVIFGELLKIYIQ